MSHYSVRLTEHGMSTIRISAGDARELNQIGVTKDQHGIWSMFAVVDAANKAEAERMARGRFVNVAPDVTYHLLAKSGIDAP